MLRSALAISSRSSRVSLARSLSSPPPPSNFAGRALAWYNGHLNRNPLLTKSLTSFAIVGFGDIMCQLAIERVDHFDAGRWLRASVLGGVLVGPALHVWYNTIARLLPGSGVAIALKRLAVDQLIFAPLMIPTYMASLMVLEGRAQELTTKLRQVYLPTLIANYQLWVPAQFITFRYIPLQHQVLWANFVSMAWNTYLSFAAHNNADDHANVDEKPDTKH